MTNKQRKSKTLYRRVIKVEVIMNLGGKCQCCGESLLGMLSVDHINGRGRAERHKAADKWYFNVKKQGYPKDKYRVLCHNCNQAIFHWGRCPHQDAKAGTVYESFLEYEGMVTSWKRQDRCSPRVKELLEFEARTLSKKDCSIIQKIIDDHRKGQRCSEKGCYDDTFATGLCTLHYARVWRKRKENK